MVPVPVVSLCRPGPLAQPPLVVVLTRPRPLLALKQVALVVLMRVVVLHWEILVQLLIVHTVYGRFYVNAREVYVAIVMLLLRVVMALQVDGGRGGVQGGSGRAGERRGGPTAAGVLGLQALLLQLGVARVGRMGRAAAHTGLLAAAGLILVVGVLPLVDHTKSLGLLDEGALVVLTEFSETK